eukprot:2880453-Lingulodinium_polyedra.AAC.1
MVTRKQLPWPLESGLWWRPRFRRGRGQNGPIAMRSRRGRLRARRCREWTVPRPTPACLCIGPP